MGYKKSNQMPTLKSAGVNRTRQSGVERLGGSLKNDRSEMYIGEIITVYSEKNTCDVKSLRSGQTVRDIPVATKAGLISGEVYGELDMPEVGDLVIVWFIENRESLPVILGTVIPFLSSEYAEASQTPVNSSGKAYTLKLLETGKENAYRRIFKSGTTLEVDDDGSVTIEVPSGTYIRINETDDEIVIEDQHGNITTLDSDGEVIEDANGNTITMDSNGVIIEDAQGTPNKITFSSSGVVIDDTNGNDITMTTAKVTINGNLEVLQ